MLNQITKSLIISFALTLAFELMPDENLLPYRAISSIFPESEKLQVVNTCQKYACKTASQKFSSDTCGYFSLEDEVIYTKPCKKSSDVCYTTDMLQNRTCKSYPWVYISLPGDKCSDIKDCYYDSSTSCTNGKCKGTGSAKTCTSSLQCDPSLSCRSFDNIMMCASLIDIGETGCLEQYDCVYAGACNITSVNDPTKNTCVKIGSLAPGTEISEETCTENSNICSSRKCAKNAEGKYFCTGPIVSNGQFPVACPYAYNSTAGCESKVDTYTGATVSTYCNCAWNQNGDSYCDLQAGDSPMVALWTETLNWQSSASAEKCHTYWRNPTFIDNKLQCISEHYDSKNYSVLLYRYLYASSYVTVYNSEDCVINTFFPYYLKAEDNYNNGGNSDNAAWIALAISSFLITL